MTLADTGLGWELKRSNDELRQAAVDIAAACDALCDSLQPGDLVAWDPLLYVRVPGDACACVFLGRRSVEETRVADAWGSFRVDHVPALRWWFLLPTGEIIQYSMIPYGMRIISRASSGEDV